MDLLNDSVTAYFAKGFDFRQEAYTTPNGTHYQRSAQYCVSMKPADTREKRDARGK
jgi:hypothetical protein